MWYEARSMIRLTFPLCLAELISPLVWSSHLHRLVHISVDLLSFFPEVKVDYRTLSTLIKIGKLSTNAQQQTHLYVMVPQHVLYGFVEYN